MLRTSRYLVSCSALGLIIGGSSCVPITQYDKTKTALQAERLATARAEARVAELERTLQDTETKAREQEQLLEEHEKRLAASNLDVEMAATARDNAVGMVEQLRGELARAGEHLRTFSEQKQELSQALAQAQVHPEKPGEGMTLQAAALIRDLALVFHGELSRGRYELTSADSKPTLVVPLSDLGADSNEKTANGLVPRIAEFMSLHSDVQLVLALDASEPAEAAAELKRVRDKLIGAGLSDARVRAAEPTKNPTSARPSGTGPLRLQFVPAS